MKKKRGTWTLIELLGFLITIFFCFIAFKIGVVLYDYFYPPKADARMLGSTRALSEELREVLLKKQVEDADFPVYIQDGFSVHISHPAEKKDPVTKKDVVNKKHPPQCKGQICVCLTDEHLNIYTCYLSGNVKDVYFKTPVYRSSNLGSKNGIMYFRFFFENKKFVTVASP